MEKSSEFERFFKENYTKFYCYAYQLIDDEETVRDIISDGFEYAWKNWQKINVDNWNAYLYAYIRNRIFDHLRHQQVEEKYALFYTRNADKEDDISFREKEDDRMEAIQAIIRTLPKRTQFVLHECYINKKKYKEVAEELDISTNAIKQHLVKALKTIREEIKKKAI